MDSASAIDDFHPSRSARFTDALREQRSEMDNVKLSIFCLLLFAALNGSEPIALDPWSSAMRMISTRACCCPASVGSVPVYRDEPVFPPPPPPFHKRRTPRGVNSKYQQHGDAFNIYIFSFFFFHGGGEKKNRRSSAFEYPPYLGINNQTTSLVGSG